MRLSRLSAPLKSPAANWIPAALTCASIRASSSGLICCPPATASRAAQVSGPTMPSGSTCASPNDLTPGVSITHPPPGSASATADEP